MTDLFQTIENVNAPMKEALRKLVRIPSVKEPPLPGKPFGQPAAEALDCYLELAQSMGFRTQCLDHYVGTVDFGEGEPLLGILCHLDVVPAGEGWTHPAFDLTEQDGVLYGRGVIDDKGPAVSVLYALHAIQQSNTPLRHAVRLIVGCDEECGSSDMEYYRLHEAFPKLVFTPDGSYPVINIEKGRVQATLQARFSPTAAPCTVESIRSGLAANAVPDRAYAVLRGFTEEEVKAYLPQEEGIVFVVTQDQAHVHLEVQGVSGHASTPEKGKNALTKLLEVLSRMPFGGCDGWDCLQTLARRFPYGETDGRSVGLNRADDCSGALTLALDVLDYSEETLQAVIDIRFPVCESVESVEQALREALGETFDLIVTGTEPHYVSEHSDFVQTLLSVYEEQTGQKGYCIAIGGGTYVHEIEGGVAFGAEFPKEENHMHGADECLLADHLILNAKIFARAIQALCGQ